MAFLVGEAPKATAAESGRAEEYSTPLLPLPRHRTHYTALIPCVLTSWSASTALTCSWFSKVLTEPSSKVTLSQSYQHPELRSAWSAGGVKDIGMGGPYWKPLIKVYSWPILPPWSRACFLALLRVSSMHIRVADASKHRGIVGIDRGFRTPRLAPARRRPCMSPVTPG